MNPRILHAIGLVSACLIGLPTFIGGARAEDVIGTLQKIKESATITLGTRESSVPFSYLDAQHNPVGYSVDLCLRVVERVKQTLGLPALAVHFVMVSPAARIPLLTNGTIDLECSTTSITLARMRQVAFSVPTFVVGARILTETASGVKDWGDLRGRVIGVAQGTNGEKTVKAMANTPAFAGTRVLTFSDHGAGLLSLQTDRIDGYVTDDIVLEGLRAKARDKDQMVVTGKPLTFETFAIGLRRDDPDFQLVVDSALADLFRSPEINVVYEKWFSPLGVPMSDANTMMYKIGGILP
jgi:glutamate/aspartate transport system substrate-binding protein